MQKHGRGLSARVVVACDDPVEFLQNRRKYCKSNQNVGPLGGHFGSTVIAKSCFRTFHIKKCKSYLFTLIFLFSEIRCNGQLLVRQSRLNDTHGFSIVFQNPYIGLNERGRAA